MLCGTLDSRLPLGISGRLPLGHCSRVRLLQRIFDALLHQHVGTRLKRGRVLSLLCGDTLVLHHRFCGAAAPCSGVWHAPSATASVTIPRTGSTRRASSDVRARARLTRSSARLVPLYALAKSGVGPSDMQITADDRNSPALGVRRQRRSVRPRRRAQARRRDRDLGRSRATRSRRDSSARTACAWRRRRRTVSSSGESRARAAHEGDLRSRDVSSRRWSGARLRRHPAHPRRAPTCWIDHGIFRRATGPALSGEAAARRARGRAAPLWGAALDARLGFVRAAQKSEDRAASVRERCDPPKLGGSARG